MLIFRTLAGRPRTSAMRPFQTRIANGSSRSWHSTLAMLFTQLFLMISSLPFNNVSWSLITRYIISAWFVVLFPEIFHLKNWCNKRVVRPLLQESLIYRGFAPMISAFMNFWKSGSNPPSYRCFHIWDMVPLWKKLLIHCNYPVHSLSSSTFFWRIAYAWLHIDRI